MNSLKPTINIGIVNCRGCEAHRYQFIMELARSLNSPVFPQDEFSFVITLNQIDYCLILLDPENVICSSQMHFIVLMSKLDDCCRTCWSKQMSCVHKKILWYAHDTPFIVCGVDCGDDTISENGILISPALMNQIALFRWKINSPCSKNVLLNFSEFATARYFEYIDYLYTF